MTLVKAEDEPQAESNYCLNLSEIPLNLSHDAEKLIQQIKSKWMAVHHHSLPQWLKDNQFLLNYHRPVLPSFYECFKSIFRIHTETVNIWTHLLGCFAFLSIAICYIVDPYDSLSWQDQSMFLIFFAGAFICMTCSWTFHTVFCHSKKVALIFNKLDYCGICFLTVGSFIPWVYYSFYCNFTAKIFHMSLISVLGSVVVVLSMFDKFASPTFRTLRATLFVLFGLCGLFPTFHYIILYGVKQAIDRIALTWIIIMAVCYIGGAVIYACRIPERFFPGKFDIVFQSHQIFHICVIAGAFFHYYGLKQTAIFAITKYDCIGPIIFLNPYQM